MFNLGLSEIILISIIALIFIGPNQLPELARSLGRALSELKRASEDLTSSIINPKNYDHSESSSIRKSYKSDEHHDVQIPEIQDPQTNTMNSENNQDTDLSSNNDKNKGTPS